MSEVRVLHVLPSYLPSGSCGAQKYSHHWLGTWGERDPLGRPGVLVVRSAACRLEQHPYPTYALRRHGINCSCSTVPFPAPFVLNQKHKYHGHTLEASAPAPAPLSTTPVGTADSHTSISIPDPADVGCPSPGPLSAACTGPSGWPGP